MSKKADKTIRYRFPMSMFFGAAVYSLLCLMTAYGIIEEWIPMEAIRIAEMAALILSTAVIAAVSRGGREALLFGASFSALYLIWIIAAGHIQENGAETGIGVLICALCPCLFSCIFHKRKRRNTNSNRKKKR